MWKGELNKIDRKKETGEGAKQFIPLNLGEETGGLLECRVRLWAM